MKKINIPDVFFFFLLFLLSLAFYKILHPYFIDIFLAVVLAHLMRGVFIFLSQKLKFKKLAAAITVFLTVIVIIIPFIVVGIILANELVRMYASIVKIIPSIQAIVDRISDMPFFNSFFDSGVNINVMNELTQTLRISISSLVDVTSRVLITMSVNIFHLFIICFLVYFLYTDGEKLYKKIMYLSPLDDREEQQLMDEVIAITDATLLGTMFVGVVEGVYGGLLFYLFNIGSPVFWGVVIMILSVIPIVGAIFVLVPAGVLLIVFGRWIAGVSLIILAYVGTTITQSYMKPLFVSRRAGPHPAIIFLSTLGGLVWLGPVGFIVGPVFASLFLGVWNQFGYKYKRELDNWNKGKRCQIEEVVPNDVY